jgi:hypothetical protein
MIKGTLGNRLAVNIQKGTEGNKENEDSPGALVVDDVNNSTSPFK